MSYTAIIFSGGKGNDTTPVRDLKIGGLNSARRMTHALRAAGCTRAFIAANALQSMAPAALGRAARGLDVSIVPTAAPLEMQEEGACLLVPADLLVDQRILTAMLADSAPFVFIAGPKDSNVGIGKVPSDWLREKAPLTLDYGTFQDLIAMARADAKTVDIRSLDAYMPSHRRVVPMMWQPVTTPAEAKVAFDTLLDAAQKGVQDWPAWYIHRPIEHFITARLTSTPVTPNQITVIGAVVGLAAAWLFAQGVFLVALILALAVGVLDGVDGKLARVKLMTSTVGELEHVVDKIVEYFIYFGMAHYFAKTGYGAAPYVMAGALVLFHLADEVQLEFFRRMSGKFLCDFSPFDRGFRMIDGRRNTQLWTFIPFLLFGAWFAGFCMICAYGIATFFIHQLRVVVASRRVLEDTSPAFRETFNRTAVIKLKTTSSWNNEADQQSKPAE